MLSRHLLLTLVANVCPSDVFGPEPASSAVILVHRTLFHSKWSALLSSDDSGSMCNPSSHQNTFIVSSPLKTPKGGRPKVIIPRPFCGKKLGVLISRSATKGQTNETHLVGRWNRASAHRVWSKTESNIAPDKSARSCLEGRSIPSAT